MIRSNVFAIKKEINVIPIIEDKKSFKSTTSKKIEAIKISRKTNIFKKL